MNAVLLAHRDVHNLNFTIYDIEILLWLLWPRGAVLWLMQVGIDHMGHYEIRVPKTTVLCLYFSRIWISSSKEN